MHLTYPQQIRNISRLMLEQNMDAGLRQKLSRLKKIVWGAGESGKTFVSLNADLGFEYIVDTRKHLQGTTHENLDIYSEERLFTESKDHTLVFLPNVIHEEIKQKLFEKGFTHVFVPAQLNPSSIVLKVRKDVVEALIKWMNEQGFNYVCRGLIHENIKPSDCSQINLLLQSEHIYDLIECPYLSKEADADTVSIDVVWATPIGLSQELPYYTKPLTDCLLNKQKQIIKNGMPCTSPELLLYIYLYDIILQNGHEDAIAKFNEELNYFERVLDITIPRSLEGVYGFVQNSDFPIPVDFSRKWAEKASSTFFKKKLG